MIGTDCPVLCGWQVWQSSSCLFAIVRLVLAKIVVKYIVEAAILIVLIPFQITRHPKNFEESKH